MFRIKLNYFKKNTIILAILMLLPLTACSASPPTEIQTTPRAETIDIPQAPNQLTEADAASLTAICLDLYEQAAKADQTSDLSSLRTIVNRFGENGYPAVDSKNQINMVEAGKAVRFCERAAAKEEAEITIIEVTYKGGFLQYDLEADDGKITVLRTYYQYENGAMQQKAAVSYPVDYWSYTEEGYFLFSGTWFSKEQYVLTLSGTQQHTAFRVQPLDEAYRELNRKYLLPIGYEYHNMFLTDWSEEDFGELNFYDIYDIFYPVINGRPVPYPIDDNLGNRAVYRIPKDVFEGIIMTYFNIDSETLQAKTIYHAEDETYEYTPRGFYEVEYPEYPYSEVVGCTEHEDGTMTLTVQVVFPYADDSKVYAHELTIRPLENGGVQYVANHVIPSEDNDEPAWYVPRLTKEAWKEMNGGT